MLARLTDVRISDPLFSQKAARNRRRRAALTSDGRLSIMAADHPARRVTKAGADALAMADRHDYLARVMRVLAAETVDGVMATMDILEDILILNEMIRQAGGTPPADGKLLIGSLNRGGLLGVSWEMDDPMTGPTPASCAAWHLDGTKLLLRICDDDPGSLKTLRACAQAVTEANQHGLPTFLEPLPAVRTEKGFAVTKTAEALAALVGVASALGDSSQRLWLKLPHCTGYARVAGATTLPILLLGGESAGDPVPFFRATADAMASASNVRGALVGRNVLYPGPGDPLTVAEAVGGIIHRGWTVAQAESHLAASAGRQVEPLQA
jgi:DhnA family fructose-bisphosphate aldolase class Ia